MALNNHRTHYPLTQPENPFQKIFVDRYTVEGVQVTKVGMENCMLADIDRAIEILQQIKAEMAPKPEPAPAPAIIPLYDDEPAEMTAVLGPRPDPTGWYARSLKQVAENPRLHPQYERPAAKPTCKAEPRPPMPTAKKGKGVISLDGIMTKAYKNAPARLVKDYKADIIPGKSIRIYGIEDNLGRWDKASNTRIEFSRAFDLTFKIGDRCVYKTYNTPFRGHIVSITKQNITIDPGHGSHNVRLDLYHFIRLNRDYDEARINDEIANYYD